MVNDLLELDDTALTIDNGKGESKKWILDDKDNFWLENKYWHWKDVRGWVEIFSLVNSFIANLPWSESFDFQIFQLLSSKLYE